MARRYSIEGPDKHLYEFDAPEDASKDAVMGYAKQLFDKRQAQVKANQNKGTLGDLGTALKQGVAEIPAGLAGLADIPVELVTGKNYISEAGKKLADVTGIHPSDYAKSLEEEKSIGYQKAQEEANALWKAHDEGKASYGDIAAFYAKHPALTATNVAESAPSMLLGGVYGRALKGAGALGAVARGAIGEGAVTAGQINAQLEEEGGGSRQKALAALGAGATTGLIGGASGKLARRMGIIDPETFLAGEAKNFTAKELADFEQAAQRGLVSRFGVGALQEGVFQELPQSVQEQMFQNWGAGKPIMEGVARSAVEGALSGSIIGGGFNTLAGGNVAQQIQAKKNAEAAIVQAEAEKLQRQATGVMEQQPLFTEEEAPTPAGPVPPTGFTPPAQEETPISEPTTSIPGVAVPTQGELFTPRGKPSPEALASVEEARLQGLPAKIQELTQTPEGIAELSANRKMYFPDLDAKERNKTIQAIQQGTYGVQPAVAPEGTLTPDVLKSFDISPRSKQYKALAGANLADPTTYNLLTTAASTSTDFGVKANRILEAFPHYNPNAAQPDLFGVPNAPQAQVQAEKSVQPDLFGVPENGAPVIESGSEQGVGQPVQQQAAPIKQTQKPVGRGVDVLSQPTDGNIGQPARSPAAQPSTLAPVPKGEARKAAAALKKEPVATTWNYFSDTPFAKLSKVAKDKIKDAHAQGYLTQELADDIERIESNNIANANVANKIATGSPEMAAQVLSNNIEEAIATQQDLEADPTATQAKKDAAVKKVAKLQKQLAKLTAEESTVQAHIAPANKPDKINAFLDDYNKSTEAHPWDNKTRLVNNAAALQVSPQEGQIHIHDILSFAPASYNNQGSGGGSKALRLLTNLADKHGVELNLTAQAYSDKGLSDEQLHSWYSRHGFKDDEWGGMVRKPKAAPAPSVSTQPIDNVEAKQVEKALTGKSQVEAAKWLAENAPDKSMKLIADKVAIQLQKLKDAGVNQKLSVVHVGDAVPRALHPNGVLGISHHSFDPKNPYVHVYLKGTDFSNAGTTYKTALHELIHAVTQSVIMYGSSRAGAGTKFSEDVNRLNAVRNAVVTHFNKRVAESKSGGAQLTQFEQDALANKNNALSSLDEMVTWALTDSDMQAYLEAIPYKSNQSLWSEFVTTIRNMLGIPASANTALSEVLSVSEALLNADISAVKQTAENAGYALHVDPRAQAQAQQYINGMSGTLAQSVPTQPTTTTQVLGNIASTMVTNPSGAFGMIEELANKFRTKVIDKAAHLSAAIQDANDGAFYNMNGQIRADLLMSAANNVNNYINAVFTMGGMEILPNGSMRATDATHSVDGVFRHAQSLGQRIGVEQARALITNAFYHYRAKSIIDNVPRDQWPENWQKDPRIIPTQAQINAAMAAFNQFPELRAMQTEFIGAKNEMVKFLEQAGFLSPEKARAFLADNSYAPWLRLKEYQDVIPGLGNTGRMVDLRQMKALVGGTEEVNDMLENMAQMIGWCVRSGVSNHTANSALNTMTTMGTATRHVSRPGTGNPAHIVMTYEAGKPVFWTVDNPYDLAAFQTVSGMNSAVMKEIGKWLGKLRAGIVLFPAFPLRQVVMDSQRAFVEAGVDKPWAMMGKIYKSFLSGEAFRGTDADIQELMSQGVVGGADFTAYDTTRGRANQFGMGEAPKTISDKFVATSGYNFLHKLAYSADLAVRLGIYRQTLEETGDKTLAATRAREIINFQKSGTSEFVHTLKHTIPFMGAYLQGMDVNYKGMVGRGNTMKQRKAAAAAYWGNMAMYAGLVTLYTMSRSGDDDYEDQKGFITDRNFVIPGGGLIPVPTDVGFLAKVVPERITDYILQEGTDNPESLTRLRQGIVEAAFAGFGPPAAVYGAVPAIEIATNYSFFSNMPIVSQRMQGLEPFQQYTSSTSEFAKNVGDAINFSPMKLDYIFNAIGGTSAGALLQLSDVMMGSEKIEADKTPVISSFQQKSVGGRYAEEYYAVRELAERTYNTAKALQDKGDQAKLDEYLSDPKMQARIDRRDAIESIHQQLVDAQRQRNAIESDTALSPHERRLEVNRINAEIEAGLRDAGIRQVRREIE